MTIFFSDFVIFRDFTMTMRRRGDVFSVTAIAIILN